MNVPASPDHAGGMLARLTADYARLGWDPADLGRFRMEAAVIPVVPDDLAGVSDEDLAALVDAAAEYAAQAAAGAAESDEALDAYEQVVAGVERARAEQDTRAAAAAERADRLAGLAARLDPPPAAPEGTDESAEGETEEPPAAAPPAVAAAAATRTPARPAARGPALAPLAHTPPAPPAVTAAAPIRPPITITAAADIPGVGYGAHLPGLPETAEAVIRRWEGMSHDPSAKGGGEQVVVASVHANAPADRILRAGFDSDNSRLIQAVTSPQAIAAAGGTCAPYTPYYDLMVLAGASRPVRDSKAGFQADRQGITLLPPPRLSQLSPTARTVADGATNTNTTVTSATAAFDQRDVGATISGTGIPAGAYITVVGSATSVTISAAATATATGVTITITRQGAVGYITQAQDLAALNGTTAQIVAGTKPVIHVTCPSPVNAITAAISAQLEFGNWTARAYPEQVAAWLQLLLAVQARRAETALLDIMSANSTQVTATGVVGAARDLIVQVAKASAYYRNANRMAEDATLHWEGPAWVVDLAVADLVRGSGYEAEFYSMARQMFVAALAELNVRVSFYLDSGTGKGQLVNSGNVIGAGAIANFPSTVVWYLYAEGSWLFLDGGRLDLGVVRDSALNSLNNYRMFSETFEGLAFVGVESLEVTSTVAPTGTFAGPAYGSTGLTVAIPTA